MDACTSSCLTNELKDLLTNNQSYQNPWCSRLAHGWIGVFCTALHPESVQRSTATGRACLNMGFDALHAWLYTYTAVTGAGQSASHLTGLPALVVCRYASIQLISPYYIAFLLDLSSLFEEYLGCMQHLYMSPSQHARNGRADDSTCHMSCTLVPGMHTRGLVTVGHITHQQPALSWFSDHIGYWCNQEAPSCRQHEVMQRYLQHAACNAAAAAASCWFAHHSAHHGSRTNR
jgi:hypothetical protein